MTIMMGILAVLVVMALAGVAWLWKQLQLAQQDSRRLEQQVQRLLEDLGALCHASVGAGDHVVKLEQQIRRVLDRQDQLELRSSNERSYQQAIEMVQRGASVEELIQHCGLTRGEADLIVMLHGMAEAS